MQEPSSDSDWTIDLTRPPRESRTDPRLPVVAEAIRAAQSQLNAIVSMTKSMEDVIRDCAAQDMTRDEIAEQCSISSAAVDRVLEGGTLFDLPQ